MIATLEAPMLVNCVAYQDGKRTAHDLPREKVAEFVRRGEGFVWVAFVDPTPEEIVEMQRALALNDRALDDLRTGDQQPKVDVYGRSMFVVAHPIDVHEGELVVGELYLFVGPNYVLSMR